MGIARIVSTELKPIAMSLLLNFEWVLYSFVRDANLCYHSVETDLATLLSLSGNGALHTQNIFFITFFFFFFNFTKYKSF